MGRAAPRLRIGFDARALVFPAGGVRRYARELFSILPVLEPEFDFIAVDPPPGLDLPAGTRAGARAPMVPTNLARSALTLPLAIRRSRVDLFHAPAYTAPLVGRTPVVLTIHDVSYARRPEFYPHASGPLRRWFYRHSAARAAAIVTDSEFSRSEIQAAYGTPASRITVAPLGVGSRFAPGAAGGSSGDGLPGAGCPPGVRAPFALHVGELHPRRDLATALRAVVEARGRGPESVAGLQLVCAGTDRGGADALRRAAAESGAHDAVVLLGAVSENDLARLYQEALALIYPSVYEGFGLPVLEAMASGLPVVAARAGSVPEVLGDAGILVEPGDWRAAADALTALAVDPGRRAEWRERGLARARQFSWTRTAAQTLDVYRGLLERAGRLPRRAGP